MGNFKEMPCCRDRKDYQALLENILQFLIKDDQKFCNMRVIDNWDRGRNSLTKELLNGFFREKEEIPIG